MPSRLPRDIYDDIDAILSARSKSDTVYLAPLARELQERYRDREISGELIREALATIAVTRGLNVYFGELPA